MSTTPSSQGFQSKLAIDADATFDANSERYEFTRHTLKEYEDPIDNSEQAIRGTLSADGSRVAGGLRFVYGSVWMNPTWTELNRLWPRLLGGTESSDVFPVADTLPEFYMMIDMVAKVHTFACLKTRSFTLSGSKGQPLTLKWDLVGVSETVGNAGTFPGTVPAIPSDGFYTFNMNTMTLDSTARQHKQFAWHVDYGTQPEHYNSTEATNIDPRRRSVWLALSAPYIAANTDLYTGPKADAATGITGTLALTRGSNTTSVAFAKLVSHRQGPDVPGKTEIMLPLRYKAYETASTKEIIVTHAQ